MAPWTLSLVTIGGLAVGLGIWLLWAERRAWRRYRRWRGGRWGLVRTRRTGGVGIWAPEVEIEEGEHVVRWEEHPSTRVRAR